MLVLRIQCLERPSAFLWKVDLSCVVEEGTTVAGLILHSHCHQNDVNWIWMIDIETLKPFAHCGNLADRAWDWIFGDKIGLGARSLRLLPKSRWRTFICQIEWKGWRDYMSSLTGRHAFIWDVHTNICPSTPTFLETEGGRVASGRYSIFRLWGLRSW